MSNGKALLQGMERRVRVQRCTEVLCVCVAQCVFVSKKEDLSFSLSPLVLSLQQTRDRENDLGRSGTRLPPDAAWTQKREEERKVGSKNEQQTE